MSVAPIDSRTDARTFLPHYERNHRIDHGFTILTQVMAWAITALLLCIVAVVGYRAFPALVAFGPGFLISSAWDPTRDQYGILPMIIGTLASSAIGLVLASFIGVGTAVFLSEDFLPVSLRTFLVFLVELLAAIPSVVYGLWGVFVLVPLIRPFGLLLYTHLSWIPLFSTPPVGPGLLPASLVLAVMLLPIITAVSRNALASVPVDLRQAAYAVGSTRLEALTGVIIPAALSGIISGIMLALGRAMGETMAVTLLIGNAIQIPKSLFDSGSTISSLLANQFAEASGLQVAALMYAALALFVLTLIVNILAQVIVQRFQQRY